MTYDSTPTPAGGLRLAAAAGHVVLTQAELDQLVNELESLRATHRAGLAERLRHARGVGVAGDNDDHLAAYEDAAVDEAKITQLERVIASATVIAGARSGDGMAGLGSVVRVEDTRGRRAEYEIVGIRNGGAGRPQVTPASPMGQALLGARAGNTVSVMLPDGRERSLRVLAVVDAEAQRPEADRKIA
jgi:transcription elongation factor GreA